MKEKIDVINNVVYVYDVDGNKLKDIDLTTLEDLDLSYFYNSKMTTFNLTNPIKRVIKFQELNGIDTTAEFQEFIYSEMNEQQKIDFDNFIKLINV